MKNLFLFVAVVAVSFSEVYGQETRIIPQITVSGEGKIEVAPDQALILVAVETKGAQSADVKKQNDETVARVIKEIKDFKLPKEDVQTQRINLSPQYDYQKKKYTYQASQSIKILLKDLSQYDLLMQRLIDAGINYISGVEFISSKIEELKSTARKKAMADAKRKAEDFITVLDQKVGKALNITDQSQVFYPQFANTRMKDLRVESTAAEPEQTLAIGQIEIVANVNVTFQLDDGK
jgi:uncharacterized protein YggE